MPIEYGSRENMIKYFMSKVTIDSNGCWLCPETKGKDVRAHFYVPEYGSIKMYRASYIIFNGPIPDDLLVRHTCDNPRCVNPEHLILGTQKDNMQDMAKRNRSARYWLGKKQTDEHRLNRSKAGKLWWKNRKEGVL